jgi:hypothetical protein
LCLRFFHHKVSWAAAVAACRKECAVLAEPRTDWHWNEMAKKFKGKS